MKKTVKVLALVLALSMVFGLVMVGCGSSSSSSSNSDASKTVAATEAPAATTTTAPAAAEPVTLKVTFWGSPQEKSAVESATKAYSAKFPNVTVEATQIPESDYDAKISALVASNDTPDWGYYHGQQGEQLAKDGKFINLYDKLANDKDVKKEDFVDGIFFTTTPDFAWGVGGGLEAFALFYNKDLFKAAGVAEPSPKFAEAWTWDQFVDAAKKLTLDKNGKNAADSAFDAKNIKQFGVSFESWFGPIQVHVLNNGGNYLTEDGKEFGYSKPEATKAIQRLADLINVHHVAPSPIQAKAIPGQAAGLQAKMIAMAMAGQWINLDLGANKVNYGIAVLPKMDKDSGTEKICGAVAVSNVSKNPEEAWNFSKFMMGEGVESLYQNGLWMPTLKKYYTDAALLAKWATPNASHPAGYTDCLVDMMINHSKPAMAINLKNSAKIDALVSAALDPVWMGKTTAEKAMKDVEPKVTPEIQGWYGK